MTLTIDTENKIIYPDSPFKIQELISELNRLNIVWCEFEIRWAIQQPIISMIRRNAGKTTNHS